MAKVYVTTESLYRKRGYLDETERQGIGSEELYKVLDSAKEDDGLGRGMGVARDYIYYGDFHHPKNCCICGNSADSEYRRLCLVCQANIGHGVLYKGNERVTMENYLGVL